MHVAIYVRVSTQEQKQHGISVDAQEAVCREWVQEHGHHLTGVYNDAGLSARAKYTKRRAMLQLIDDIRAGKVELIIFTKLDRWFRNVADYYEVQAILEQYGVKWRAIQEDYETETASGRFKVNIMLAVAQDEADRTSERIKAAADYKKAKGEAVGRAPIGYIIKDKRFEIDPETGPAMRAFFDAYLKTFRLRDAQNALLEHGISFNATRVRRTLRNRTYCGDHFGVPCPSYITPEQYQEIRNVAENRTRETKTRQVYLFGGLMHCGLCGAMMTCAAPYHKDKIRRIKTYRCGQHAQYIDRCPGTYINESKLESYLLENLPALLDLHYTNLLTRLAGRQNHQAEIRSLEGKLSRLKELYIEGEIDRAAYDARSVVFREQISKYQAEDADLLEAPAEPLELPEDWKTVYEAMTEPHRKLFWQKNIKDIIIYKDRPPAVKF